MFATLHSQVKRIKESQKVINHELNNQEPLLENFHNDTDRIKGKMIKQINQIKNYLEKTSNFLFLSYWN